MLITESQIFIAIFIALINGLLALSLGNLLYNI
uniref:Photosystem I reaction center subunit XII n=3 Tax=Dichotomosiphonaceae TaxID=35433 RepID=A0A386AX22_9CHLO|nr:photosystem I reaction center subunit M [Avrainvillea mazei]AYC63799.1 photosystem I reaction center subunit M [Dichotomosiphon tuberosus]AYC63904.1 photosystem I reaction center subunit M [Dichotomosiphon tuberosus]AYJ22380.1 photosystem I reaction center subunit M [Avrainvillea sp. HV04061]